VYQTTETSKKWEPDVMLKSKFTKYGKKIKEECELGDDQNWDANITDVMHPVKSLECKLQS